MPDGLLARFWRAVHAPGWFTPIMGALIGVSWVALLLWEQSPYGRYLDHGNWTAIGLAGTVCRIVPAGRVLLPMLLYVGGWLLMVAAMMLPTTLPLLGRFRQVVSARGNHAELVGLLIAGYLTTWVGFGLAAHLLDLILHEAVRQAEWLRRHSWLPGAAVLLVAGAFQFTALKYRCLDQCRTPTGFIVRHWHGLRPRHDAFSLGLSHGVFCVGCCWAIMLLMFAVGMGNVGWMLVLGAVMAVEKNADWGRKLAQPLGVALVAAAALIVIGNIA
jgi:predicted metal-binding membrane protein